MNLKEDLLFLNLLFLSKYFGILARHISKLALTV